MSKTVIAIPSKGRPEDIMTAKTLKGVNIPIHLFLDTENEKKEYFSHPDSGIGNVDEVKVSGKEQGITKMRNFILDSYPKDTEILMLDDDIEYFTRLAGKSVIKIDNPRDLENLFKAGFNCCRNNDTKLWGIYPVNNHFFMSNSVKSGFINGVLLGIIKTDIKFDNNLRLKQDYEITCRHVKEYGKVVRFNMYSYKTDYQGNKGGCKIYRTDEMQKEAGQYIIDKYPQWASWNTKREGYEILLNFKNKKEC